MPHSLCKYSNHLPNSRCHSGHQYSFILVGAQVKVGLHTWTLRWIQVSGLSFVGSGRCIRMFLLCSLVVPRGPVIYTGQEYTPRAAETGVSLAPWACVLTLTGGRGLGWLEKVSCKAPSVWSHSACWSCNPIRSNPISGTLGLGLFSTWGRQKIGKIRKGRVSQGQTGWAVIR